MICEVNRDVNMINNEIMNKNIDIPIEKLYYTFDNLRNDLRNIVDNINKSEWEPDIIIGPCRGAYIPGVMLSHWYKKPFHGFTWQTRDGNEKDYDGLFSILKNNMNKNILIIDDINDSGVTLNGINDTISEYYTKNNINMNEDSFKFCVLFNKKKSSFKNVDYYAKILEPDYDPWIVFPYEEW